MDLETVDHLLTTTRSVRKNLDFTRPVEAEVLLRCIEIAIQAPTGSNAQGWHFVIVTDAEKRARIAEYYARSFAIYIEPSRAQDQRNRANLGDARAAQAVRVRESGVYLADHMHEVPVMVIPCIHGRVENSGVFSQASVYGSILPATWSLMLALRARGIGSAWTTLHLRYEQEVAAVLGIPDDFTQAALLPVAYYTKADFKPAVRLPIQNRIHWNSWGIGQ